MTIFYAFMGACVIYGLLLLFGKRKATLHALWILPILTGAVLAFMAVALYGLLICCASAPL